MKGQHKPKFWSKENGWFILRGQRDYVNLLLNEGSQLIKAEWSDNFWTRNKRATLFMGGEADYSMVNLVIAI